MPSKLSAAGQFEKSGHCKSIFPPECHSAVCAFRVKLDRACRFVRPQVPVTRVSLHEPTGFPNGFSLIASIRRLMPSRKPLWFAGYALAGSRSDSGSRPLFTKESPEQRADFPWALRADLPMLLLSDMSYTLRAAVLFFFWCAGSASASLISYVGEVSNGCLDQGAPLAVTQAPSGPGDNPVQLVFVAEYCQ